MTKKTKCSEQTRDRACQIACEGMVDPVAAVAGLRERNAQLIIQRDRLVDERNQLVAAIHKFRDHINECDASWKADGQTYGTKAHGLAVCLNNRAGELLLAAAKGGGK